MTLSCAHEPPAGRCPVTGTSTAVDVHADDPATDLMQQAATFYRTPELQKITAPGRADEIRREIAATGTYRQTSAELLAGSRLAWRNHARCLGRFNWRSLELLDARECRTAPEVAEACWEHLRVSTNDGKLRSVITVFAPRSPSGEEIRIWNPQLLRYAGYRRPDGRVVGDPLHVRHTEFAQRLGWRGAGGRFDVLPLIVQVGRQEPQLFPVPPRAVFEVELSHPELPWFAGLGLRWHVNPAISNLHLEIGGLTYPAAPFSGWYVSSEIGARNLSDENRYDMLPAIADRMGLDRSRGRTLWRDRALLELNLAVLHSFQQAGVHIIDHHAAAAQFVAHVEREHAQGRAAPADWAWVNPPMSASTTPTFHRLYDPVDFDLRPNFLSRADPLDEVVPAL
ncbi:nitric-oxide synthase [Kineosporia succinea]|uniref:Nitric oxide synthase oxygenase n=1 Tax=Kineosporia succinea TaxID=84632 RepID=A0ABT9PDI7_9ACTN|nr:nitric oxide synthase oxygenase [Kineosporia succinea]MDP9830045.1 nitric-oxide synthase [Kineosporia succinea]